MIVKPIIARPIIRPGPRLNSLSRIFSMNFSSGVISSITPPIANKINIVSSWSEPEALLVPPVLIQWFTQSQEKPILCLVSGASCYPSSPPICLTCMPAPKADTGILPAPTSVSRTRFRSLSRCFLLGVGLAFCFLYVGRRWMLPIPSSAAQFVFELFSSWCNCIPPWLFCQPLVNYFYVSMN